MWGGCFSLLALLLSLAIPTCQKELNGDGIGKSIKEDIDNHDKVEVFRNLSYVDTDYYNKSTILFTSGDTGMELRATPVKDHMNITTNDYEYEETEYDINDNQNEPFTSSMDYRKSSEYDEEEIITDEEDFRTKNVKSSRDCWDISKKALISICKFKKF